MARIIEPSPDLHMQPQALPDHRLVEHSALDDAVRATTNDHLAPAGFGSGRPG